MEEKEMVTKPEKISSWFNLQPDILSLIKSRLFAGDINTFNMICRPWRSIMPTSRVLPPPIDSPLAHTPCLVTLHNSVCEFYHPVYNATYKLDTPELLDSRIRSSGYGWLLLSQDVDNQLFFFNPFTKEKIHLPHGGFCQILVITFSSPPTSPDCFVIGMTFGPYNMASVITVRRGDASWKLHHFYDDNDGEGYREKFMAGAYCSPVLLNGKCFFLGEMGNIGEFDVKDNTWQVYGNPWPQGLTRPFSLVLEKDGVFLAVFLSREHRKVRVRRFYLSKMVWEDVESLESDKMLYVSDGTSFLETSVATGMGNKIYFPIFDRGNNGVFYSLSTKKYHSFDGKYCNKYRFNLYEPRSSTWIKPVYPATTVEGELEGSSKWLAHRGLPLPATTVGVKEHKW